MGANSYPNNSVVANTTAVRAPPNNISPQNDAPLKLESKTNPAMAATKAQNFEFIFALAIIVVTITLFVLGNLYWNERYYTPEEGLGYYLGLVGGSMMLLALSRN